MARTKKRASKPVIIDHQNIKEAWERACALRDDIEHLVAPARDAMTSISATTPKPGSDVHARWNDARYVYESCVRAHDDLIVLCSKLYCSMTFGKENDDD